MRTRCHPWFLRLQGALLALLILIVLTVVHYWPSREGWLTYVGYRGRQFLPVDEGRFKPTKPRNDIPGVQNFGQVSRNLYRGAGAKRAGYATLKLMGIKTVVDLRQFHTDAGELRGLGLLYAHIPANPSEIDDDEVAQFLRVVRNPDYQPVFVHCAAGSDRTGIMVAIYRVMDQGWPVEAAAQELPLFGFHEVWQSLLEYLQNLDRGRLNALSATVTAPQALPIE